MDANERRLAECQRVIGYYFSNPRLLETALTHSSLRAPDRECNERLEFLGDSILGLVITEELYHLLPDQSEGELTRIKSAVVSRSALLTTSERLGLARFAEFARGVGRRDRLPASVVANLVEAIIGAIYLDAGYYQAREFVLRHMGEPIDDELNDRGAKNYKSLLQHEVQQSIAVTPTYRTVEAEGPDHAKEFVVAAIIRGHEWGRATGNTKKEAEQEAAHQALEAWNRRGRGRRRSRGRRGAVHDDDAPALEALEPDVEDTQTMDTEGPAPEAPPARPRRRRRRRSSLAGNGEVPPTEAATPSATPAAEDGPEPEPEPEPEAAPAPAAAPVRAEAPTRRPRRRRRSRSARGEDAAREGESRADEIRADEAGAQGAPEVPTESAAEAPAPPPAAEVASDRPARPRRRRARRAPSASDEPAPQAPEAETPVTPAPEPQPERAPAAPKAPRASPRPPAAVKAPAAKPEARVAAASFGAGIDVPAEARKRARAKTVKVETAKVDAPARRPAPISKKASGRKAADAEGGFGAGI